MTKWTNDTERQFDELVAGLPEGAQKMIRQQVEDVAGCFDGMVQEADIKTAVELATRDSDKAQEPEFEEESSWEPAWERDAVMELLRLISVSPQWLTADGAKVLIDAAKDRCGANDGDLVEESDVREAFDALS